MNFELLIGCFLQIDSSLVCWYKKFSSRQQNQDPYPTTAAISCSWFHCSMRNCPKQ